jgi:hypothetical protein
MAYLDPVKGTPGGVPGDPRDMAKAGLPELSLQRADRAVSAAASVPDPASVR